LDAGPWQYAQPEGLLSDGMHESYRLAVPLDGVSPGPDPREHVLAVRVYDRYENVGSAKMVVR
jgi:hypothetical protein